MFVLWQASLEDIHHKALFSACVVWIFWGVGFCVRKQAICSWDLPGMRQFRLGFRSLHFQDEEAVGQSVLYISLTSQCTQWYLLSFPLLAGRRTEAQGMPWIRKVGVKESRAEDQPPASTLWAPDTQQHACWHCEDIWNWECVCFVPFLLTGLMR